MESRTPELRADLAVRLRRIEGQVRGVQKMIDDGRECTDILQQMAAIRSAVHQASLVLTRAYLAHRLEQPASADGAVAAEELVALLGRLE